MLTLHIEQLETAFSCLLRVPETVQIVVGHLQVVAMILARAVSSTVCAPYMQKGGSIL